MTDKQFALDILRLLSALESWGFADKHQIPDFLHERIAEICDRLEKEILK